MDNPLKTPARIAFAGDWHMNTRWAQKAVQFASDAGANVIVHLGDFGFTFDLHYMDTLNTALQRIEMPLLFVDGNHECFTKLHDYKIQRNGLRQLRSNIWHLPRGFRWEWDGIKFLALGGAHSVDRQMRQEYVSWWPQEVISYSEALYVSAVGPTDVMVTHDCPAGVPSLDKYLTSRLATWPEEELVFANGHRKLLRAVVDSVKPHMIWHGHYHRMHSGLVDFGFEHTTWVTGLDCDESSLSANVEVIDLGEIKDRI